MRQFILLFLFITLIFADEKKPESVLKEGTVLHVGTVEKDALAIADKSKSSEKSTEAIIAVDPKPVEPAPVETRIKREDAKEPESVLKEGVILDVGAVGSKDAVAQSKAIANKSKSSESSESKEEEKEKKTEAVKLSKVPTEEIAVAHKKAGEDEVKIATATKSTIVAEKIENSRARRFA